MHAPRILLSIGFLVSFVAAPAGGEDHVTGPYFGETPPTTGAVPFSPGFASTQHHVDMSPGFSPDGREVIFRINGKHKGGLISVLCITRMDESGVWSTPQPLPFLTRGRNGHASFAPDGSRL